MPLLDALARLNAAWPWSHNAHYHPWLLRRLPRRFERALDVGCGAGDLVRLLATRAAHVHGIDSDSRIIDAARRSTDPDLPVVYAVADGLSYDRGGPPSDRDARLLPAATRQQLLGLVSVLLNPVVGWVRDRGRRTKEMTAVTRQSEAPYRAGPGRRLFWRYTLVWKKVRPGVDPVRL
ncbi:class I SAM-dependent methyltransferase [Streptomyces sp. NPDC057253]|uniref:class I SAM-dependent methyltransferase n=1 Tax=Streptomyces sp. NPDC057253 TaxID=3346069 RepID=UPI003639CCE7